MKEFFRTIPRNIVKCFTGWNLFWQIVAIALTYTFVLSGFDWTYFVYARNFDTINYLLFPAIVIGAFLPVMLPIMLIVVGRGHNSHETAMTGWALGQAALIGSIITSLYKTFTGRIQPNLANTIVDISRQFNFGFMKHGIDWGWPSSHTTIAFAMIFCMLTLHFKSRFLRYGGILYAIYIGIGVSTSIHWFSEFVAGAIMGTVIGIVVGRSFYKSVKGRSPSQVPAK